ncbi:hypothetical protein CQW37_02621 [Bacteroides fragilis]|uniref:DUF5018-related domain-containing protein n=1 Tax=Bacteroides fragilis TaxID=817 RepID=UPI000C2AF9E6|nr:hypothetical protein [Bacteroides fragilis]MCE9441420.1 hypothetical protein [Bacteroides fragilis]MCZ2567939.1 hypothetical protein [Bacteroides fragilis]PJY86361.1 hypothetical protein CQW37_02621 [Bacteroides fragilis]
MKIKDIKWLFLLVCMSLMTACDWEDLPAYEEAEITAVQFYYRWPGETKDPITGEPVVKEKQMTTDSDVSSEGGTIEARVTVPGASGDFNESVRAQVSQNKLWGQVTVSTAARIIPIEGSSALGTPDDWSSPRKFEVTAADGTKKVWTIKIVGFNK